MLELLIGVTEATDFHFDSAALAAAAVHEWPDARIITPQGRLATVTDLYIEVGRPGDVGFSQLAIQIGCEAIGLDAHDQQTAARILAWLAATAPLPPDGSVVVIHWTDDFYPLLPGVTYEQLMEDATTNR